MPGVCTPTPQLLKAHTERRERHLGLMEAQPFGENGVITTLTTFDQLRLHRNAPFSRSVRSVTATAAASCAPVAPQRVASLAAFRQDTTLIAVIEISQSSWLVAWIVPGIDRHPLKKLAVDQDELLRLLHRWRDEAVRAGRKIERITADMGEAAGRVIAGDGRGHGEEQRDCDVDERGAHGGDGDLSADQGTVPTIMPTGPSQRGRPTGLWSC